MNQLIFYLDEGAPRLNLFMHNILKYTAYTYKNTGILIIQRWPTKQGK